MKAIIFSREPGTVSIFYPPQNAVELPSATVDELLQRGKQSLAKWPTAITDIQVIETDQIPQDRTFRNAWEHGGDKVQINMDRAREIQMGRIRQARNAALAALDIETLKAVGKGDDKARAATELQKQVLRDIPQTIDLSKATMPDELKAIWPQELESTN